MDSRQWDDEITKLDQLIALLENAPPSPESAMAEEHVQSARSCAWAAMPAECEVDLNLARTAIGHIPDSATRQSAEGILSSLPTKSQRR